ncbi:TonB-dependent receptor [Kineobactrum sediminis]|uniref:TonB-dependent receptor n=1 Tax=Kineobactrum sediminis TaxID=1905677 RepID=A0A2N5XZS4_9GAMM|nr:TonB-dependent receptor [Kineobactrum sediminis]PLW81589.1 TonB-dependent receptor [Kineobactrum sediminis]
MPLLFRKAPLVAAIAFATAAPLSYAQLLEEVIVTAQKRAQSLQDVPISVSAIQGGKIQSAGIPNMQALSDYVPNLYIAAASVNTNIYMRGVGSGNNQGFEQSVGMYIDGVYMSRGRQYRAGFMDLERIEVLRGPQGTLFGKNTVAGAINIITASPTPGDEFSGSVSAAVESNDGRLVEGFLQGSLSETFAARLGFKYREADGYMDNEFLNRTEGDLDETGIRLTTVWQPTDTLDITFKYSNTQYERIGSPSTTKNYLDPASRDELFPNRSAFANIAYALTDRFFPDFAKIGEKEFVAFKDNGYGNSGGDTLGIGINPDGTDEDYDNFMLNVDYEVMGGTLTSITGWSEYQFIDGVDVDWLPLQFIHRDDDQQFEQFSQEFRFASAGGEFFDYVVGAYFEQSTLEIDRRVTLDLGVGGLVPQLSASAVSPFLPDVPLSALGITSLMTLLTGGQNNSTQIGRNHLYEQDSDSFAVFGQGTFNLADNLRLTVGLRYTEESKEVDTNQFLSDSTTGMGTPSEDFSLLKIEAESFNAYTFDFEEKRRTDKWLPSVNLQWDVTANSMLYASYSQGFKSGGFTDADDGEPGDLEQATFPCEQGQPIEACYDPTNPNDDFEFDDEEVDAFEIGGKHTLLDGGMTLNWAAFYTQYDNLQTSIFKGISFGVTNAAQSEIKGIEVDMLWQATDRLRIGASGAWLDATYDSFEDAPCTAIQLDVDPNCGTPQGFTSNDLSGEETMFAPAYTGSITVDYEYPISNNLQWFLSGETNYRDDFEPGGDNDPIDTIDSYSKTNLRTGLRGDNWEVMAFGRNIFDKEVIVQSFDTPVLAGTHSQFVDEGRIVGVRAQYSF